MDLAQYATVAGITGLVVLILQTFKPYLDTSTLKYIPYISVGLAIVLSFVAAFGLNNLTTNSGIAGTFFIGLFGGLAAIGTYEATFNKVNSKIKTRGKVKPTIITPVN